MLIPLLSAMYRTNLSKRRWGSHDQPTSNERYLYGDKYLTEDSRGRLHSVIRETYSLNMRLVQALLNFKICSILKELRELAKPDETVMTALKQPYQSVCACLLICMLFISFFIFLFIV